MGPRSASGFGFLHFLFGLFSVLVAATVFTALVLLVLWLAAQRGWISVPPGSWLLRRPGSRGASEAGRILDERLARGEVEIDDYSARREALAKHTPPPFRPPHPPPPPNGKAAPPPAGPAAAGPPHQTPPPAAPSPTGERPEQPPTGAR